MDDEGTECNNTKKILNCRRTFYTNLYSIHNIFDDEPLESKTGVNSNKLENEETEKLDLKKKYNERVPLITEMEFFLRNGRNGDFFYEMEPHKIFITNLYVIASLFVCFFVLFFFH